MKARGKREILILYPVFPPPEGKRLLLVGRGNEGGVSIIMGKKKGREMHEPRLNKSSLSCQKRDGKTYTKGGEKGNFTIALLLGKARRSSGKGHKEFAYSSDKGGRKKLRPPR